MQPEPLVNGAQHVFHLLSIFCYYSHNNFPIDMGDEDFQHGIGKQRGRSGRGQDQYGQQWYCSFCGCGPMKVKVDRNCLHCGKYFSPSEDLCEYVCMKI